MRAARFHGYGPPDVLVVENIDEPHPGPGEIRIRVAATSVSPVDTKFRSGAIQAYFAADLPAVPGRDAAGIVDEIGDAVTGVAVGDRVFGLTEAFGTAAEHAVLAAWAPVPDAWSNEQAAGAGLVVVTAICGLNALGDLSGQTLLVEGAAGGVGSATVAVAVARGARVIGTASEPKHDFLRTIGAVPTTYGPGLAQRVASLEPASVDAVIDAAGSGSLPDLIDLAGPARRIVTVSDMKRTEILRVPYISALNDSAILTEGADYGNSGQYNPHVAAAYRLDDIADAHRQSETGHTQGKIVLTP